MPEKENLESFVKHFDFLQGYSLDNLILSEPSHIIQSNGLIVSYMGKIEKIEGNALTQLSFVSITSTHTESQSLYSYINAITTVYQIINENEFKKTEETQQEYNDDFLVTFEKGLPYLVHIVDGEAREIARIDKKYDVTMGLPGNIRFVKINEESYGTR